MAATAEGDETFIHQWEIDISAGKIYRLADSFTTVRGMAVYEWKLKLAVEGEYEFLRNAHAARDALGLYQLTLEPNFLLESPRTHLLREVTFLVEAKTTEGVNILGPVRHVAAENGQCALINNVSEVRVPADSKCQRTLQEICTGQTGAAILHITTILQIPKRCFELGLFTKAAPGPPAARPSLFRVLDDTALYDVRLRCQDGTFPCNRTALFQTCKYFRQLLRTNRPEYDENCSLAALSTVVVYMLTGTYRQPSPMTVKLTEDIIHLIRRYRPTIIKSLHVALEKSACEKLAAEADCLEQVLKWYLAAADCDMHRLSNVALAILLSKHYNQLAVEFIVAEPRKPHLRELHEKLHTRTNIFRSGPLQKILHLRGNAVLCIEKMSC